MRWDRTATFPFTSPSLEMELRLPGADSWVECLGCGEIKTDLLKPGQRGWAFGIGLERIAMLLFGIKDIRTFWSTDDRFTSQFEAGKINRFTPFSNFNLVSRDISFWIGEEFEINSFFEMVRESAGGALESVKLIDEFVNPAGKKSLCFRLEYRGVDHNLSPEEINVLQSRILSDLSQDVVLR